MTEETIPFQMCWLWWLCIVILKLHLFFSLKRTIWRYRFSVHTSARVSLTFTCMPIFNSHLAFSKCFWSCQQVFSIKYMGPTAIINTFPHIDLSRQKTLKWAEMSLLFTHSYPPCNKAICKSHSQNEHIVNNKCFYMKHLEHDEIFWTRIRTSVKSIRSQTLQESCWKVKWQPFSDLMLLYLKVSRSFCLHLFLYFSKKSKLQVRKHMYYTIRASKGSWHLYLFQLHTHGYNMK